MLPAEADHIFTELIVLLVLLPVSPVQPGNLVILTVGIVIAKLGIQKKNEIFLGYSRCLLYTSLLRIIQVG